MNHDHYIGLIATLLGEVETLSLNIFIDNCLVTLVCFDSWIRVTLHSFRIMPEAHIEWKISTHVLVIFL